MRAGVSLAKSTFRSSLDWSRCINPMLAVDQP
jgi:hypothetical protein